MQNTPPRKIRTIKIRVVNFVQEFPGHETHANGTNETSQGNDGNEHAHLCGFTI
jgi:hypothetical protein